MDNTALLLLLSMVVLIAVIVYLFLYPTSYAHLKPYPVMPGYGPYWSHGGQANSGLLY